LNLRRICFIINYYHWINDIIQMSIIQ
jgi:hypothetical protein